MICKYCNREISSGEQKYNSKQVGMEGVYHWSCFVEACKKVKKQSDDFLDSSLLSGDIDLPYMETSA